MVVDIGLARQGLAALISAERERWILWLPAGLAAGVVAYFWVPVEPPAWAGAVVALAGAVGGIWARRRIGLRTIMIGVAAVGLGTALAQARTAWVAAPMPTGSLGTLMVTGTVVDVDQRPAGTRVVLEDIDLSRAEGPVPLRVRVRLNPRDSAPATGARIQVLARLSGPRRPIAPGAYDFRRQLFFDGIGATGFAFGRYEVIASAEGGSLEGLRNRLVGRIDVHLDPPQAGVVAALLTGERGGVDEETWTLLRDAGLAHLLAISGLHVGLVAGGVFLAIRLGLAAIPPAALRWSGKKIAAVAALVAALAFTLLVGAPVPTQRAFIMTAIFFIAVLIDRDPLSMRLVAWAAVIVMAVAPEAVMEPGLQMSFGAVIGLIAAYERLAEPIGRWRRSGGLWRSVATYAGAVMLSTAIASAATAPPAAYHFQRLPMGGSFANLIAVPVTAFWIMPWGMVSYVTAPLGADGVPLEAMALGVDVVLGSAEVAVDHLGGSLDMPAPPASAYAMCWFGMLWLCLWRGRWRWLGVIGPVVMIAATQVQARPTLFVAEQPGLIAVRDAGDRLMVNDRRRGRFVRDGWLRRDGQREVPRWPAEGTSESGETSCDPLGCIYRRDGYVIALIYDGRALTEDCRVADIVVALVSVPRACPAEIVIDSFDLYREGTHAVYLDGDTVTIETVARASGRRPWSIVRPMAGSE